jgi:hypothetical protein
MATIHDKVGHLETLPIDLLYAHLDASFIFNHLETMNGGPNSSSAIAPRKKPVYNSFGLNHLRGYGPVCDESLPYPITWRCSRATRQHLSAYQSSETR